MMFLFSTIQSNISFTGLIKKIIVVLVIGLGVSTTSHASISLDRVIKSEASQPVIKTVRAMVQLADGSIVSADSELGGLVRFTEDGHTLIPLIGDGKVFVSGRISGLALIDDQRLMVTNEGESLFAMVTADGSMLRVQGSSGSQYGAIDEPNGIAYSSNQRLYIADRDNNRISVFSTDGVFLQVFGQSGLPENQRLRSPEQVFVDPSERVYVFEQTNNGVISVFNERGQVIKRLDAASIKSIVGHDVKLSAITIDETGLLYLADSQNGRIIQLDWENAKQLSTFGSRGEERGQFRRVTSLLVLKDGRIAVADSDNDKIEIYKIPSVEREQLEPLRLPTVLQYDAIPAQCDLAYRLSNGKAICLDKGNGSVSLLGLRGDVIKKIPGKFSRLTAATSDPEMIVIIDDNRIKTFTIDGDPTFGDKGYGGAGSSEGKLDTVRGAYLKGDRLYIADTDNRRIQIFTRDGIYLDKITNPQKTEEHYFSKPVSVVVDAQNNIYVADTELNHVLVFDENRKLLYKLGGNKDKTKNPFERVYDIEMDADNNLYILCAAENNRYTIQLYRGPQKIISFGSYAEAISGIRQPTNITVAKSRKTIIGVYDQDKKRLINFSYLQVPARVAGVQVLGGEKETVLKWQTVPGSYIAGYNIYGSDTEDGDYRFILKTVSSEAVVKHNNDSASAYYKISAASGLGTESKKSRPQEDVFRTAYRKYTEKKYSDAIKLLQSELNDNQEQPDVLKYLGLAQFELKQIEDANASFTKLTKIKGYEAVGRNLLIRGLVEVGEYIAAKKVVDELLAEKQAGVQAFILCGEISLRLNDAIGAVTCLEQVLSQDEKNTEAHFLMGEAYIKLGLLDKGMQEFDIAAESAPKNIDVWYRSAIVLQQLNQHQQAVDRLNKALEIDDGHIATKLALAHSYLELKQYDQVRNIAISLASYVETAAHGQYLLGLVALASNNQGEALLAFTKSTRLDSSNDKAWLSLADTYILLGQHNKLRETLVKAVEANPASFEASYRLGMHDYDAKQYDLAMASLLKAVAAKDDHYKARLSLAKAAYETGDYQLALNEAGIAAKQKPDDHAPLVLLADVSNKQGKVGKAIDYMKQAMSKQSESADLYMKLGALYIENNIFDLAEMNLEKSALLNPASAQPHVLLGSLYLKRRLFDKAIKAYDKAVSVNPDAQNKILLDAAYAEKKKALDFKSNAPQVLLSDLRLNQVFSAAYKQYANRAVGKVRIQNTSGSDYANLKLTFAINGYMDFPTTIEIPLLAANSSSEFELMASFNNRILDIDEDTGVQVEVALHFVREGRDDSIALTQPMTIYGKNAIVWDDANMVGAFVTPKDDSLRDFVRQAINENKPAPGPLNDHLVSAMTLFNVLSAHGIRYVVDPNNPYASVKGNSVDYVQFGRETLKIKSGDCDDLSILLSAGLENLGIETAIVDVPGHLLMMFNTGLDANNRDRISLQDDLLVVRNNQVWIPLEATMMGTSFTEAWAEGAKKYQEYASKNELTVTPLKAAWQAYSPVTLKPANFSTQIPAKDKVHVLVNREQNILLKKSLDRLVKPYEVMAESGKNRIDALMQVAIIYAKNGLHSQAEKTFERILQEDADNDAVHNNRGNVFYSRGEYDRAIEAYEYAEQLAANDAGVKVNLAMARYQLGELDEARQKFNEAVMINQTITKQYDGLAKLLSN
ncbi:MAG TPA: tetratricopeptide repeat protein [Gammaproteobacteria bacterium]